MAGNSWQQPVAGEPSCGTLHFATWTLIVDNVDPSTTNVYTVDLSSYVPAGTKAVYLYCRLNAAGGATELTFSNSDKSKIYSKMYVPGTHYGSCVHITALDASRNMYWYSEADAANVDMYLAGYFI